MTGRVYNPIVAWTRRSLAVPPQGPGVMQGGLGGGTARGKSEHDRTRWWVTPTRRGAQVRLSGLIDAPPRRGKAPQKTYRRSLSGGR